MFVFFFLRQKKENWAGLPWRPWRECAENDQATRAPEEPWDGIKRALKLTSFVFGFAQLEALFCCVGKIES